MLRRRIQVLRQRSQTAYGNPCSSDLPPQLHHRCRRRRRQNGPRNHRSPGAPRRDLATALSGQWPRACRTTHWHRCSEIRRTFHDWPCDSAPASAAVETGRPPAAAPHFRYGLACPDGSNLRARNRRFQRHSNDPEPGLPSRRRTIDCPMTFVCCRSRHLYPCHRYPAHFPSRIHFC